MQEQQEKFNFVKMKDIDSSLDCKYKQMNKETMARVLDSNKKVEYYAINSKPIERVPPMNPSLSSTATMKAKVFVKKE